MADYEFVCCNLNSCISNVLKNMAFDTLMFGARIPSIKHSLNCNVFLSHEQRSSTYNWNWTNNKNRTHEKKRNPSKCMLVNGEKWKKNGFDATLVQCVTIVKNDDHESHLHFALKWPVSYGWQLGSLFFRIETGFNATFMSAMRCNAMEWNACQWYDTIWS